MRARVCLCAMNNAILTVLRLFFFSGCRFSMVLLFVRSHKSILETNLANINVNGRSSSLLVVMQTSTAHHMNGVAYTLMAAHYFHYIIVQQCQMYQWNV